MDEIDTLVFSGGGIKSISILGILSHLIENKILEECFKNIKKIYYTSGSSIFTFPLLFGFNLSTTVEIFKGLDWGNIDIMKNLSLKSLLTNYGFTCAEDYNYILEVFLKNKNIKKDITLKEVYELNNIEINFNVFNITKNKYESLNYKNTPNLPIITAINMTSCIPILFKPVEYNCCLYVDGGLIENIKYDEIFNNKKSLGINIIPNDLENPLKNEGNGGDNNFKNIVDYLSYLYDTYKININQDYLINHIKVAIPGFGGSVINYKNDIDKLIKHGYNSSIEHFKHQKQIDSNQLLNEGQKDEGKN